MAGSGFHVLTARGDATEQVDSAVREIGSAEAAGLHRVFFVSRADQTVVMTRTADSELAVALRRVGGWEEPAE